MSIYIGNDLEDRLEVLEALEALETEDRIKALETENASLKKHNWYMKSIICQTCIKIVVSISIKWISINTLKLRNGMILQ